MRRWLFNILAGLSLLLCIALLAAGALTRSDPVVAWHKRELHNRTARYIFVTIRSGYIGIGCDRQGYHYKYLAEERRAATVSTLEHIKRALTSELTRADSEKLGKRRAQLEAELEKLHRLSADGLQVARDDHFLASTPGLLPGGRLTNKRESYAWTYAGFSLQRQADAERDLFRIVLPIWMLTALLLIVPLLRTIPIWRSARRRRRMKRGLCANCGYDIRASHDRCPECGQVTTRSKPSTPAVPS